MAGILDLLESPGTVVPAGPINAYTPPPSKPTEKQFVEKLYQTNKDEALLNSISGSDNDFDITQFEYPSMSDFVNEYKTLKRKDISPDYIYKEGLLGRSKYKKSPLSLFTDSYDPNSESFLSAKQLEREYGDFVNILNKAKDKNNIDELFYNEVFSPAGNSVIEMIEQYQNKYNSSGYIPETYKQLLGMESPKGSA